MAASDDHASALRELADRLTTDDPRLARRLAAGPMAPVARGQLACGAGALLALTTLGSGMQATSAPLTSIAAGLLVVFLVSALLLWRVVVAAERAARRSLEG